MYRLLLQYVQVGGGRGRLFSDSAVVLSARRRSRSRLQAECGSPTKVFNNKLLLLELDKVMMIRRSLLSGGGPIGGYHYHHHHQHFSCQWQAYRTLLSCHFNFGGVWSRRRQQYHVWYGRSSSGSSSPTRALFARPSPWPVAGRFFLEKKAVFCTDHGSPTGHPPPPPQVPEDLRNKLESLVNENTVMIFSKTHCPFCKKVKGLFNDLGVKYQVLELDTMDSETGGLWQEALFAKTGQRTVPNVFVKGQHLGGCDDTFRAFNQNKLLPLIKGEDGGGGGGAEGSRVNGPNYNYDYDLIVLGGGSGGLAASKAAAKIGKKVAVCDFVQPTPTGTSWGLGGTCVNVGCIPKKLMHQAALVGEAMSDAPSFGWNLPQLPNHEWGELVENIQMYIKSLNWGYRVVLNDASVTYLNEFARFIDAHTIETLDKEGVKKTLTADKFIVAVGGRPRYPEIPGALEYAITSDDIFSLPYNPGKVLCIGASYIALECAGFLAGVGIESSVMVRSILLRGFDQQIADMIGAHMEDHGVKFYRGWMPTEIVKIEDGSSTTPPSLRVTAKETDGEETIEIEVNTVLIAIGREPCTKDLNLDSAGVKVSTKSGKILTTDFDQSTATNIYAIGDVAEGRPELTPAAIHAGELLAKRLFEGSTTLTDYDKIPTTVFTPLEYGCCGLSEEDAVRKYGAEDIEVYHTHFQPLEAALPGRDENKSYCKLVCLKSQNERVVGFHYLGPNAGEITQGFAVGVKMGATKADFDSTIGIIPTSAETFTTLEITKSSGASALKTAC